MTEIKAVPQFTESEIAALLDRVEECTHPDTENGFCIDCGAYFNARAENFNFSEAE